MPRVSIRRLFLYVLALASSVLLVLNLHQSMLVWTSSSASGASASGSGPGPSAPSASAAGPEAERPRNVTKFPDGTHRKFDLTPLDPSDMRLPASDAELPWYMSKGSLLPKQLKSPEDRSTLTLLPEESPLSDRIPDQLMFSPPVPWVPADPEDVKAPLKRILLWNGASSWGNTRPGRGTFLKEKCPVNTCAITSSRVDAGVADLIIFKDHFTMPQFKRPEHQLWMMYMLECPLHTQNFHEKDVFNWTSTYRRDSTIVAPYERWSYYNDNIRSKPQERNFAANKTKAVAWFVSNCGARNNRLQYARELQQHIDVDIYGGCGDKKCPRSQANTCFDLLNKRYKFYLAFENSNCKDYITEKFFVNGLGRDVIPIVMGARPEDYELSAPNHSYIHVDDYESPKHLAEYLHKLDQDDNLYNEYFTWKGTGEFINTKFFCRVCSMLHDEKATKTRDKSNSYVADMNEWWRGDGTCINGSWRKFAAAVAAHDKAKASSFSPPPEPQAVPVPDGKVPEAVANAAANAVEEDAKLP